MFTPNKNLALVAIIKTGRVGGKYRVSQTHLFLLAAGRHAGENPRALGGGNHKPQTQNRGLDHGRLEVFMLWVDKVISARGVPASWLRNWTRKETRMGGYHPDWVGALTAGVGIGLALFIGIRIWPQPDRRKRVMFIAVVIGVALAVAARTAMRLFGM